MLGVRNIRDIRSVVLVAFVAAVTMLVFYSVQELGLQAAAIFVIVPAGVLILPMFLMQTKQLLGSLRWRISWCYVLWLLLFLSALVFRVRTSTDIQNQEVDSWAAYRIVLVAVTGMALVVRLGLRGGGWIAFLFHGLVGPLTFYALFCAISTVWSVYPTWTFYRSVEYLVDVALLAAILTSLKSEDDWYVLFNWNYALQVRSWLYQPGREVCFWPKEAFVPSHGLLSAELIGVIPSLASNGLGQLGGYRCCHRS